MHVCYIDRYHKIIWNDDKNKRANRWVNPPTVSFYMWDEMMIIIIVVVIIIIINSFRGQRSASTFISCCPNSSCLPGQPTWQLCRGKSRASLGPLLVSGKRATGLTCLPCHCALLVVHAQLECVEYAHWCKSPNQLMFKRRTLTGIDDMHFCWKYVLPALEGGLYIPTPLRSVSALCLSRPTMPEGKLYVLLTNESPRTHWAHSH